MGRVGSMPNAARQQGSKAASQPLCDSRGAAAAAVGMHATGCWQSTFSAHKSRWAAAQSSTPAAPTASANVQRALPHRPTAAHGQIRIEKSVTRAAGVSAVAGLQSGYCSCACILLPHTRCSRWLAHAHLAFCSLHHIMLLCGRGCDDRRLWQASVRRHHRLISAMVIFVRLSTSSSSDIDDRPMRVRLVGRGSELGLKEQRTASSSELMCAEGAKTSVTPAGEDTLALSTSGARFSVRDYTLFHHNRSKATLRGKEVNAASAKGGTMPPPVAGRRRRRL
ncbi:hypothetical protein L1887_48640 [Cichorium endivia]|nr:hypothetical protein L1887_48640 [Cichorium endivia]